MKISYVEKSGNGYLVYHEDGKEGKEPIICQEIRGSVIVPDLLRGQPGYYLLLGRKCEESKEGVPFLVFLKEESEHSREALIGKLVSHESRFRYHEIYTEEPVRSTPGEPRDSFFMDIRKAFRKKIPWVKLTPAYYQNDVNHGVNLFSYWRNEGALEIPRDTILSTQIGSMEPGVSLDESFYAFNALCNILSGFKLRNISIEQIEKEREESIRKDLLKDLTGIDRVAAEEIDRIRKQIEDGENENHNDILTIL